MPAFTDISAVEGWLAGQPEQIRTSIAVRAALRVLPLIVDARRRLPAPAFLAEIALPVFRASTVAWTAAKYPSRINPKVWDPITASAVTAAGRAFAVAETAASTRAINAAETALRAVRNPDTQTTAGAVQEAARATEYVGRSPSSPAFSSPTSSVFSSTATDADVVERSNILGKTLLDSDFLLDLPLWPSQGPEWAISAFGLFQEELLGVNAQWKVWTDWYSDRLAGRRSNWKADLIRAQLSDELWGQGPEAVNAELGRLLELAHTIPEIPAEPIPRQGAGPHFALGSSGKIGLAPPSEIDAVGNHIDRIHQLLPLVRRAADDLVGHLSPNAFPELTRDVTNYSAAIADAELRIAWGTVFGLGIMLENSAEAAQRQIADRLQPALEDPAQAALDSLLTLHGPLILATADGRELSEQAERMRLTREEQTKLRAEAQAIACALRDEEVTEPPATEMVVKAADAIGEGRHSERGAVYGIATVKNLTAVLVSAATVAAVGTTVAGLMGPAAGAGATWLSLESLKKSKAFQSTTSSLGTEIDRLLELSEVRMRERLMAMVPLRRFVIVNERPLRQIAESTSAMRWMLRYIDLVIESDRLQ
jgi:hypothetical protein